MKSTSKIWTFISEEEISSETAAESRGTSAGMSATSALLGFTLADNPLAPNYGANNGGHREVRDPPRTARRWKRTCWCRAKGGS